MNPRNTVALFLLFLALVGLAVYAGREREPREMTAGTSTPTAEPILELEAETVQEVEVVGADGSVSLRRAAGGWEVNGEPASATVDGVVSRLASPLVLRQLDADRDPDVYGFTTPTLTVTLRTQGGDEHVLVFGDETLVGGSVYVRLGGDGPIYIVSGSDLSLLKEWLLTPPLAPTATPEVQEPVDGAETAEPDDGEATGDPAATATADADETPSEPGATGTADAVETPTPDDGDEPTPAPATATP